MKRIVRNMLIGFVSISLLLLTIASLTYISMGDLVNREFDNSKSLKILRTIEDIKFNCLNIETGMRGYLIVGDTNYLRPYKEGASSLRNNIDLMKSFVLSDEEMQTDIDELSIYTNSLLEVASELIQQEYTSNTDTLSRMRRLYQTKRYMDGIRVITDNIEAKERVILYNTNKQNIEKAKLTKYGFLSTAALIIIILILVFFIVRNELIKRIKSDQQILVLIDELNLKNESLVQANNELEAFSYSVSHDLRAPLRAIDGYCRIIQEDYINELDDEAKRIFDVIQANSKKMGNLIDDLLDFSRIGRKETNIAIIDNSDIVQSVIQELAPNSSVEIKIDNLDKCTADRVLLKQVWFNLLSNAIKYSSKVLKPSIHIYSYIDKDEYVYVVEDNGVGFDDRYKHKLFNVFQRLHHEDEYEGTGVGLAIVAKIVMKHNGRVWAESRPNFSTKFYFSIPNL